MEGVLSEGVLSEGVLSGGGFVLPSRYTDRDVTWELPRMENHCRRQHIEEIISKQCQLTSVMNQQNRETKEELRRTSQN